MQLGQGNFILARFSLKLKNMSDVQTTGVFEKSWGQDFVWASNSSYFSCVRTFAVAGACTPLMMQTTTRQTWLVNSGAIMVDLVDTKNGNTVSQELTTGNTVTISNLQPYRITATQDNTQVLITSTPLFVDDTLILRQ